MFATWVTTMVSISFRGVRTGRVFSAATMWYAEPYILEPNQTAIVRVNTTLDDRRLWGMVSNNRKNTSAAWVVNGCLRLQPGTSCITVHRRDGQREWNFHKWDLDAAERWKEK